MEILREHADLEKEHEPLQQDDSELMASFFTGMSSWTFIIYILLILLFSSNLYLRRYMKRIEFQRKELEEEKKRNKKKKEGEDEDKADGVEHCSHGHCGTAETDNFRFWSCVLCVGVAFGAVFLVPISILTETLNRHFPTSTLAAFFIPQTTLVLWQGFFVASNLCHYFVLPFTYLYSESQGFGRRRTGFFWKCLETTISLILMLIMAQILLYLLRKSTGNDQISFSYLLTSLIGSFFFLIFAPFGFERIFHSACALYVPLGAKAEDCTKVLELSIMTQLQKILTENTGPQSPEMQTLQELRVDLEQHKRFSWIPLWLRRLIAGPAVVLSLLLPGLILMRSLMHHTLHAASKKLQTELAGFRTWNTSATALDITLIMFLWSATVIGKSAFPMNVWVSKWLKPREVPDVMLLHSAMLLLMGSSLPLVVWNLGLANFDGVTWEHSVSFFHNAYVRNSFNVLFILAIIWVLYRGYDKIKHERHHHVHLDPREKPHNEIKQKDD